MRVGTHLHAALEAEVSEAVEVPIKTREDAWAVRLLNTTRGLQQLLETGLARELFVFGRVQVLPTCPPSLTRPRAGMSLCSASSPQSPSRSASQEGGLHAWPGRAA